MEKCEHKYCWIHVIAAIVFIVLAVVAVGKFNTNEKEHTISVSGTDFKNVDPNKAEIQFTISTKSASAAEAQSKNAEIFDRSKQELLHLGFEEKDIETTYFSVGPEYQYNPKTGESTIIGYKADHSVKLTTNDIQSVGKVLDTITSSGVDKIDYIQFGLDDAAQSSVKQELISGAVNNAYEKASAMASSTHTMIKGVSAVTENSYDYPPIRFSADQLEMTKSASPASTELSPGQIKVTVSVGVVYLIR